MPLVPTERPAASKRPYAIAPDTFRARERGGAGKVVDAIWVGRRRGMTTVSTGTLGLWWQRDGQYPTPDSTLEECKAKADSRHGGNCDARWDGSTLWVDPSLGIGPQEQVTISETLDAILTAFPSLPEGYDGWYYLTN